MRQTALGGRTPLSSAGFKGQGGKPQRRRKRRKRGQTGGKRRPEKSMGVITPPRAIPESVQRITCVTDSVLLSTGIADVHRKAGTRPTDTNI